MTAKGITDGPRQGQWEPTLSSALHRLWACSAHACHLVVEVKHSARTCWEFCQVHSPLGCAGFSTVLSG